MSSTDSFAVWIRYRLKVYDHNGTLVSNWPVAAYGKSQAAGGSSKALQHAAVLAMRDAAALMIMKFDKVTRISQLADKPASRPLPTIMPLPEPGDDEQLQDAAPENNVPEDTASEEQQDDAT